jgi:hypothetical protein
MQGKGFLGLMDMIDGGGMGRAGAEFEGGPLSGLLNALGIRPQGYRDRMEEERMMSRYSAGPSPRPTPMYSAGPPSMPPNPYAPGAVTTTTLPPMGQMSDEALMKMIYDALQRAQSGQRR